MDMKNFVPKQGMNVIGSDGDKVGEVDAVERDYFVVSKGFFFPTDHYIPMSAVNNYDDDNVYLNVTKDDALEQDWGQAPATDISDDSVLDTNGTTAVPGSYTGIADPTSGEADAFNPTFADSGVDDRTNLDSDNETIEVREEDLSARTRGVDRGAVHVDKRVVEEQQTLEVPVTEEEVEINRRQVDRPVDDIGADFQDSSFEIPVRGEEVEVSKTARVTEEIDIDKRSREHTETVSDTVRREEVDISGDGLSDAENRNFDRNKDDKGLLDKAKDAIDPDDDRNHR